MVVDYHKAEEAAAHLVRQTLAGGAAFYNYQPGNSTSYKLVMTRLWLSPALLAEQPKLTTEGQLWGIPQTGEWCFVSWLGVGCYPFPVLSKTAYVDWGYVLSKYRCQEGDAEALALLFNTMITLRRENDFYPTEDGRVAMLPAGTWVPKTREGWAATAGSYYFGGRGPL